LRGRAEICQDERRFVLQPGDWSLYRWRAGKRELVAHLDGEIGSPQWNFRTRSYDVA
jgi:hypothetical protein